MRNVVVIGGGYGGIHAAKALDGVADVTLVEPRETFVHNVAALRAVTQPEWIDRLFIPYDGLLARGQVRRDRAVRVTASTVELASGGTLVADFVVLATGSAYPFPAKLDVHDRAGAAGRLRSAYGELAQARRVLLLGAGPVGLELAGEIKSTWPDKVVTVVDRGADVVSGRFPAEFRSQLRAQLDALGIELRLGTNLRTRPPVEPGKLRPFTVFSEAGAELTADIWFPCHGVVVNSEYLDGELGSARQPNGQLAVTPELRVVGQQTVFAIGDLTAVPEMKMAYWAQQHAAVVAANIGALIEGRAATATYAPGPDAIALPLGPKGGVMYTPEVGVLGPSATAGLKGGMYLDRYREVLGAR